MSGGTGDDIYIVDNSGDIITEIYGQGTDLIQTSISYAASNNVENITLTGILNINANGNNSANIISGNSGNNVLKGLDSTDTIYGNDGNDYIKGGNGNDIIYGGDGNDTLIGGNGLDSMYGGSGNDTYQVNHINDLVVESPSQGIDLIQTSVSYTASANVENLTLTGSYSINAIGNNLANTLTGNNGNNQLTGGDGNDTLLGNNGNDILFGGVGNDQITGGGGNDIFQISNGSGWDLIIDYNSGEDNIELLNGINEVDLTFSYISGNTRIIYNEDLLAIVENTIQNDLSFI